MNFSWTKTRFHCLDCGTEFERIQYSVRVEPWDNVDWNDVQEIFKDEYVVCPDSSPLPKTTWWQDLLAKFLPRKKGKPCPKCQSINTVKCPSQ